MKLKSNKSQNRISRPTIASKFKSMTREKSAKSGSRSQKKEKNKSAGSNSGNRNSVSRNRAKANAKSYSQSYNILGTQNTDVFTPMKN
jgi:hypothetical protein